MTKIILFVLLILMSVFSFAAEESVDQPISTDLVGAPRTSQESPLVLTTEVPDPIYKKHNPRKSHFQVLFGFEGLKYNTPYNFEGVKNRFSSADRELWGGRLGFGGEIYLGKGLNTTTRVEGYYMGTLFSRVLNGGAEDDEVKFAYTKRTGQIFGLDASQAIGYIHDMKTKNPFMDEWTYLYIEPYIEAGLGIAAAYNRLNYQYKLPSTNENYKHTINDDLTSTKIGIGLNLTANTGFFFYMRATQTRYDVILRKENRYIRANNGSISDPGTQKDKSVNIDPIMVYAIGGGYKF